MRENKFKRTSLTSMLLISLLLLPWAEETLSADELPELLQYRVTEPAPIIKGRHDKAFQGALESAFRSALVEALKEVESGTQEPQDFLAWQRSIFSRAGEFIFSYSILSQEVNEGYLILSIEANVYRDKLSKAVQAAAEYSPALPVKLLVLVDTFPLTGGGGEEDIDAGHLAASALEAEFLRRGAIIMPSPERLPWQHLEGRSAPESRISLALVEGKNQGVDYILLGRLQQRVEKLLILFIELISVSSQKIMDSSRSPVELQTDSHPSESFTKPAEELAGSFMKLLSTPARRSSR